MRVRAVRPSVLDRSNDRCAHSRPVCAGVFLASFLGQGSRSTAAGLYLVRYTPALCCRFISSCLLLRLVPSDGCTITQVAGVVNTETEAPIQYGYTASLTADSYTVS